MYHRMLKRKYGPNDKCLEGKWEREGFVRDSGKGRGAGGGGGGGAEVKN